MNDEVIAPMPIERLFRTLEKVDEMTMPTNNPKNQIDDIHKQAQTRKSSIALIAGAEIPLIFIDIKETKKRWPRRRPQKWYFEIISAGNNKSLARSETYTNRQDAVNAATLVGGHDTSAFLRQSEQGNRVLRWSTLIYDDEPITTENHPEPDFNQPGTDKLPYIETDDPTGKFQKILHPQPEPKSK